MVKAFADFNGLEIFFLICAVIGGFFVLLKLITQFTGIALPKYLGEIAYKDAPPAPADKKKAPDKV